jgi:hypothetical protein
MRSGPCKSYLQDLQRLASPWLDLNEMIKIAWSATTDETRFAASQTVSGWRAFSSEAMVRAERLSVKSLATVTVDGDCGVL